METLKTDIEFLQKLVASFYPTKNFTQLLDDSTRLFAEYFEWSMGHVYYSAAGGKNLTPSQLWYEQIPGKFKEFQKVTATSEYKLGEGIVGMTALNKEPVWFEKNEFPINVPRVMTAVNLGIKTAVALPVFVGNRVIAVLTFFDVDERKKDAGMLHFMHLMGMVLGREIERNWAEEIMLESELKFKTIFQSSLSPILLLDQKGYVMGCNNSANLLFEYEGTEMAGLSVTELVHPKYITLEFWGLDDFSHFYKSRLIQQIIQAEIKNKRGIYTKVNLIVDFWVHQQQYFYAVSIAAN